MSRAIEKKDYNLKSFFEDTLNFKIKNASFNRGTLTYFMYSAQHRKEVIFEQKPDTSMSCTIGGVTRNIPAESQVEAALGHRPTSMEMCRIIQEVILKMFDEQQDETRRQVSRDFDRFSRRGR